LKPVKIWIAFLPLLVLIGILALNVSIFGDGATSGPNQLALIISAIFGALLCVLVDKKSYQEIEHTALKQIDTSMKACLILAIVGLLIASWILAGVVPSMIYYGIKIIHPKLFLPLCAIICALVSTSTGSSWSTAGTIGVAMMGIGVTIGLPAPLVAGSIISGSYFGDKMSPLSDTTNLAPTIAGTDLFTHIRKMMETTLPALLISLVLLTGLGFFQMKEGGASLTELDQFMGKLDSLFTISPILLLAPVAVAIMVAKKVPTLPALAFGVLLGVVMAFIMQPQLLSDRPYHLVVSTLYSGVNMDLGDAKINALLQQGGLKSMFNTIALIISAMVFGGVMKGAGYLEAIAVYVLKLCHSTVSLVAATLGSGVLLNMTASDQYLAIVVTGEVFKDSYQKRKLPPELLSRTIEDGSTVTSVMIPWNTCGAYFASVLGVATLEYAPYCFFNILCPFLSLFLAFRIKNSPS
jgi:NhaC family Na+:H+ antiporter